MKSFSEEPFPTTSWSNIRAIQEPHGSHWKEAMERCCEIYRYPVLRYIQARGYSQANAEDLTQEFFLRVIQKQSFRLADQGRGRFRSFLLKILVRFLSDCGPARAPRQQTHESKMVTNMVPATDGRWPNEPIEQLTPAQIYSRSCAIELLVDVCRQLKSYCQEKGHPEWYEMFGAMFLTDCRDPVPSQQGIAEQLGTTRDKVRTGLSNCISMGSVLLRCEVAKQVGSDEDLEAELKSLFALLQTPGVLAERLRHDERAP